MCITAHVHMRKPMTCDNTWQVEEVVEVVVVVVVVVVEKNYSLLTHALFVLSERVDCWVKMTMTWH